MTAAEAKADPARVSAGGAPAARHVAIIMDGNGRWAKKRLLPRVAGHRQGVEAARRTVRAAGELGLEVLTLYAFSSENWRRPEAEIGDLMGLLRRFIQTDIDELAEAGVRLKIIGDYHALSPDLVTMIDGAIARTAKNQATTLVIALNYGSHHEITRAARALAQRIEAGTLRADAIDEAAIAGALDTADLPPVDLILRTSGEKRLSNFLLWQAAYAELLFIDTLWPDFGKADLAAAMQQFARRERRYGGL